MPSSGTSSDQPGPASTCPASISARAGGHECTLVPHRRLDLGRAQLDRQLLRAPVLEPDAIGTGDNERDRRRWLRDGIVEQAAAGREELAPRPVRRVAVGDGGRSVADVDALDRRVRRELGR